MPKISIIIPLYNKEDSIKKTIESVLNQSYENFEVIVVNDGSSDKSLNIIEQIQNPKLKIISQANSGVSAARNKGILEARGDYLCFIDADDYLLDEVLKKVSEIIENFEYDIIVGNLEYCNNRGEIFVEKLQQKNTQLNLFKEFFLHNYIFQTGTFFVKRNIVLSHLFNKDYRRYEDLEAYFDWVQKCRTNYCLNVPFVRYNKIYSSLSIPNQRYYNNDYSTHIIINSNNFFLNCSKGKLIVDAFYSYPTMRRKLLKAVGFKGSFYAIIARLWSYYKGLLRLINKSK